MKTLTILTAAAMAFTFTGCESMDSSDSTPPPAEPVSTNPANPTEASGLQFSESVQRQMRLQALDDEYSRGGMAPAMYNQRREEIIGLY